MADHRGSFIAHANYLRAFASLFGYYPTHLSDRVVLARLATRTATTIEPSTARDLPFDEIHRSFLNAWGTELILALSGQYATDDELLRLVNNWGAVQAYYACYHATQAYCLSRGSQRPDSHPKTQKVFLDCWTTRRFELAPLSLSAATDGVRCGRRVLTLDPIHPWTACTAQSAWPIAALALRSTRKDAVKDSRGDLRKEKLRARRKAWQQAEAARTQAGRRPRREPTFKRPQLTPEEKVTAEGRTRPHGLLDYLYRLRIKTNYEDSRMFTDGPEDELSSRQVHTDLQRIVQCSLLATELHVRARVGPARFADWVSAWLTTKTPSDIELGLAVRAKLGLYPSE